MAANKRINGSYTITTLNASDAVTFQGLTANTANVVIDGNLTVTGNAALSGNISGDNIFNGTTSIAIPTPSGNATISVGGTSNVAVFTPAGVSLTGNVTSGNVIAGEVSATGNIQIVRDASAGTPAFQFKDTDTTISDGTVLGSLEWYTSDATPGARVTSAIRSTASGALGNATVQIFTSDGGAAAAARITVLSTGNVGIANTTPRDPLAVTGNAYISNNLAITGNLNVNQIIAYDILALGGNITSGLGNVAGVNLLASQTITATGNVVGGNINTAGLVSTTGNVKGGNLNSDGSISSTGSLFVGGDVTLNTGGILSTTGNVRGGNLITSGLITATGTITTGSFFIGDGGLLSNISTGAGTYINNGNSNVFVNANANVTISSNGVPNVVVVTSSSANITGAVGVTGNVTAGNVTTAGLVTATGNITGGNILTSGYVTATGNIYGNTIWADEVNANGIEMYGDINWNISTAIRNPTGSPTFGASLDIFTQGVGNSRLNYNDDSLVYADSNGVGVASNVSGTANYWRFYGNGNMRAPGSVVVVGNITPNNASATNSVAGNVVTATSVLQLPVFASNAARDTGISSPTGGMLVFVTDGDGAGTPKFQGYGNATTGWTTL